MDITDALAPTSDQLDAVELVNPRTFTIDAGSKLSKRDGKTVAEIKLVNFPRVWRPSKGMLDVLAACWGTDGKQYEGRRVTLYNDPDVMYGKDKVGGIRISHLSHIGEARTVTIRASGAGRKRPWHVEPLADEPAAKPTEPTPQQVAECTDVATLTAWAEVSRPVVQQRIAVRIAALEADGRLIPDGALPIEGGTA